MSFFSSSFFAAAARAPATLVSRWNDKSHRRHFNLQSCCRCRRCCCFPIRVADAPTCLPLFHSYEIIQYRNQVAEEKKTYVCCSSRRGCGWWTSVSHLMPISSCWRVFFKKWDRTSAINSTHAASPDKLKFKSNGHAADCANGVVLILFFYTSTWRTATSPRSSSCIQRPRSQ